MSSAPDAFDAEGMVAFQRHRRAELLAFHSGDRRAEPPAYGAYPDLTKARTLSEVWRIERRDRIPYAGIEP